MNLKPLTQKQANVLDFIISQVEAGRGAPTIREIGNNFGMSSTGSTRDVFKALRKKGYLVHTGNKARGTILNPEVFKVTVKGRNKIKLKKKKLKK